MSLRILGCILAVLLAVQAFPQRSRQRESSDFNYNVKPGEKSLRSLDQINLQDENVRARNSYTDSYGNPVAYDSLDDVNAQKPSNNKNNPHQYVIPGYASGILDSREIPTRSSVDTVEGRTTDDDRIHFVDPLSQNTFQTFNNEPSTSLNGPGFNSASQSPIEIPRPNIDLPETPISSNDGSFNSNLPNAPPSTVLELPIHQGSSNRPFQTGLVPPPPQILNTEGVEIPRPNLDIHETPIDGSNNLLNQGLLPPPTSSQPNFNTNIFLNPKQDGPVVITDEQTVFAPKPSNGLLPPKDPITNNFNFQSIPSINDLPSSTTATKFNTNFEGTILGGITTAAPLQIPVQVIHSQDEVKVNKYTGSFGGSPGILTSNNQIDRVVPTLTTQRVQPSTSTIVNNVVPTQGTHNKFTGSFGGSIGLLSPNSVGIPSTAQTIADVPSTQSSNVLLSSKKKPSITFGGPAGVLTPFDNLQRN